jgi:hypothetical protein
MILLLDFVRIDQSEENSEVAAEAKRQYVTQA